MGAKQLAIVMAPNILYRECDYADPTALVGALASCNQVVFKIINRFDEIQIKKKSTTPIVEPEIGKHSWKVRTQSPTLLNQIRTVSRQKLSCQRTKPLRELVKENESGNMNAIVSNQSDCKVMQLNVEVEEKVVETLELTLGELINSQDINEKKQKRKSLPTSSSEQSTNEKKKRILKESLSAKRYTVQPRNFRANSKFMPWTPGVLYKPTDDDGDGDDV